MIVVGAAVLADSIGPATLPRIGAAAVFMGLGIVAMHYIGMETLRACAQMVNSTPLALAAAAIAIAASGLALWLAFSGASQSLPVSATVLGLAISGMHYTAMAGLSLYPRPAPAVAPALSPDLLAVIVAIVAFLVSGGVLRSLAPARSPFPREAAAEAPAMPQSQPADPVVAGTGTFSPLGGAGGPPRRPANAIPVERNGLTSYISTESIIAVRADAHYTQVFDGTTSHFCSLSIGVIESRLDPRLFLRVHRSHIVNIACVDGVRFNGDGGVIELAAPMRYSVPVSRARIGRIKARLAPVGRALE